jgi:hypothetical protein
MFPFLKVMFRSNKMNVDNIFKINLRKSLYSVQKTICNFDLHQLQKV